MTWKRSRDCCCWVGELMIKRIRLPIFVVLLPILLVIAGCSIGYSADKGNAPDFTLKSLDGQTVKLSDSIGKPVLINFWASWCGPCREEMPYLQKIYNDYKDTGLVFYLINIGESPDTINKFLKDNGYSMPVLLDSDKSVSQSYRITGIPETFFIDKNGIIRKWQIGAYPSAQAIEEDLKFIVR